MSIIGDGVVDEIHPCPRCFEVCACSAENPDDDCEHRCRSVTGPSADFDDEKSCCCPPYSSAEQCIKHRYPDQGMDREPDGMEPEECECACHDEDEDDWEDEEYGV